MQSNALPEKIIFQGRTEHLDWKKIASIDIDSLIHEGDVTQLLELIKPVTFCKADTEFDGGRIKIDPAFIKVFRISQLISELLLASQEKSHERLTNLQEKYNETEREKEKLSEEILHLKDTLTSAKKELKKRKEMLATTQNEMLGENNGDEYDQCPYCSKKFTAPGFLLAHIQRRHQGLPANPLYPSLPSGSATVLCPHSHPQTLHISHPQNPHLPQMPSAGTGVYEPHISLPPQSSQHVQTLSNQMFPAVHTPSPSIPYSNTQLLPSNLSFSGSVTSLNNLPFIHNSGAGATSSSPFGAALGKRESFTQTSLQPNVDGSHSTTDGGGDAGGDAGMANTSTLRNWERVAEATKEDVFRLPNQHDEKWQGLEKQEKVRVGENGTDEVTNAMISVNTTEKVPTTFSNNSSQSRLREDGEVMKSPADVINQPQFVGDSQKDANLELKRWLHESFQGEFKSLISRLESQEQFWQDKLASLQHDHERQIEQLRQELQIQNDARRNNNELVVRNESAGLGRLAAADDNVGRDSVIGNDEKDKTDDECSENESLSSAGGITLVEPNTGRHHQVPKSQHHPVVGVQRDILDSSNVTGESNVPVAKPRKSKIEAESKVIHSYSDMEHMSSATSSAVSTLHPIIQHHYQQQNQRVESSHRGTTAQLESLSESDPEFLTIIRPEELHQGKHDNSIVPNSSDYSATGAVSSVITNKGKVQQKHHHYQQQHPIVSYIHPTANSGVVPGNKREMTDASTNVIFDEASDNTLSDSEDDVDGDERNYDICTPSSKKNDRHEEHHQNYHRVELSDHHPKEKSSVKQTPAKKKYIFDAKLGKIFDATQDVDGSDEEGDESEHSDGSGDLNNTSSADDLTESGKQRKSQLDLVRAKTIMELEQNMSDIGLNPESTAIGMEEMKRALKHLKTQQQHEASKDQNDDYERLEQERKAIKTHAKFEATKASIDERLDALSTLNSKKPQPNSLVKIFSAVKSSGKNFGKRVASAVKKKQHSELGSGDEEKASEKRKRKSASATKKAAFFSKARWMRKKKGEGKKEAAAGDKNSGDGEVENTSDVDFSSTDDDESESEEEIEVPPFMQRSSTTTSNHRRSSGSPSRSPGENADSRQNSARLTERKNRSVSRPKSAKPLKRLNSSAGAINRSPPLRHQQKSSTAVAGIDTAVRRNSSESSPFSNVDDFDDENERHNIIDDDNSEVEDNETAKQSVNRRNNKVQVRKMLQQKESSNLPRHNHPNLQDNVSDDDDDDEEGFGERKTTLQRAGRKIKAAEDEDEERMVKDGDSSSSSSSSSSESQSEEDPEEEYDQRSFASSTEISVNAKSSGVMPSGNRRDVGNNEVNPKRDKYNDREDVMGISRHSSRTANSLVAKGSAVERNEMSDSRLQKIKQFVRESKIEVTGGESEEEDSGEEFDTQHQAREEKGSHYAESKYNYPRERKMAFVENNTGDFHNVHSLSLDAKNSPRTEFRIGKSTDALVLLTPGQTIGLHASDFSVRKQSQSYNTEEMGSGRGGGMSYLNSNRAKVDQNAYTQPNRLFTSTPIARKAALGQSETPHPKMDNSFDDKILDDLLNTTFSDDEKSEEKVQIKDNAVANPGANRQNSFEPQIFKRKSSFSMAMQPTNHHHLGAGMTALRSKAEAQSKLLENSGRGSPASRNSWDSQK